MPSCSTGRNLIAVIRSVSAKTRDASSSLDEFAESFGNRLAATARVQGLLSRLVETERVSFDELLNAELAAHVGDRSKVVVLVW